MSEQISPLPFSLESLPDAALRTQAPIPAGPADDAAMRMAIEAAGLVTYHWVIETDRIQWSANAADVLARRPARIRLRPRLRLLPRSRQFHQPL